MAGKIITKDVEKVIKEAFEQLEDEVLLELFTKKGTNDKYNDAALEIIEALNRADSRVKYKVYEIGDERSKEMRVDRSPTILIAPDRYSIRMVGAPTGEEGRSFIMSIILASTGGSILSEEANRAILELDKRRHIQVFVSPT